MHAGASWEAASALAVKIKHSDWDIVKSKYHALLLVWGINAILLALLASTWWQGLIAGALIAAAAWRLGDSGRQPAALALAASPAASSAVAATGVQPELLQAVLPVWRNHVQLARTQTQDAIDRLTQRFVGIHQRLGGVMSPTRGGANGEVLQVIQTAASQLGGIAEALEQLLSTRDGLLRKIEALGQHNDEIRQLAQQVELIAGRTGVTDLFSDQESWTELAARSAEAGRQIIGKTKNVQQQIQTALSSASQLDSDATRMMDDSRVVIDSVIGGFRESALKLSDTVEQLEEESREVDQEVCEILVNLQFQDRISQILDHVQQDMLKLVGLIEQAKALPDRAVWLSELEQTYTTQEQRQIHAGRQADKTMQSQVDFF